MKNLIEIIAMIAMFCIAILIVGKFSNHQYSSHEVRVKNLFNMPTNTIDVAFIGASEMYTGFSPEYMWKQHGVTSYNIATAGAHMGLPENQIKAILKTQKPKLYVISLNGAQYDDDRAVAEGYTRMWLDNMPDSDIREEGINTIVEGDKTSYRHRILKYHSNFIRIKDSYKMTMREIKSSRDKRLLTISGIDGQANKNKKAFPKYKALDMNKYTKKVPLAPKTEKQLHKFLKFLKDEKIDNVLFVHMPMYYSDKNIKSLMAKARVNTAIDICHEYGFETYDFSKDVKEIGLDNKDDFYNLGHLNVYGQRKMTDYFYNKVIKPLEIKSELDEKNTKLWQENYDLYEKVYKWATAKINEELPYPVHYNYELVDHLQNGTIQEYDDFLKLKGDIMNKEKESHKDKKMKKKDFDKEKKKDKHK